MQAWGEFYALVPLEELREAAAEQSEDGGIGQYPDALWFHRGRRGIQHGLERIRTVTPPAKILASFPCWGWTRCRIAAAETTAAALMWLPGRKEPVEISADLVFLGEDFRRELERRTGKPPVLTESVPDGHTLLTVHDSPEYMAKEHAWNLNREAVSREMVLGLIDGNAPVDTLATKRIRRLMRDRNRREVAHVSPMPSMLADLVKYTRRPRKNAKKGSQILPPDLVTGEILPSGEVHLHARLGPDCRAMLHGKPKPTRVPRLTGVVSQPPLAWEERTFDIRNASALQLAQGLLEMCAAIDLDFHRSASAVAAEIMRTGRFAITIQGLHRLRGGEGPPGQKDRARYSQQLEILRRLEVEVDLPDGRGILAIPFASGGAKVLDPATREVQASSFHAVPDSIVGMMLAEGGHRWQYWLDTRVLRLGDLAYTLHHVLARQWSARMTRHAVEGPARHAWNLDSVLDGTSLREIWRKRTAKQGQKWLRESVENALAELNSIGMYGAAGSARVEWNPEDIASSKVIFGDPPLHILTAHIDRNSRRIAGAKKKRKRLDERGEGVGSERGRGRVGKG